MRISRVVSTLRRIFIAGLINVPMLALAAVTPINNAQLSGTTQIVPITQTSIVEAASNGVLSGFPYSTANNGQALEVSAGMLSWQPVLVNPMTTIGDIIVGQISGAPGRLPIGANTYVLTSNGSTASWQPTASSGGTVTTISVVTANGVSATISNPTTTPALTFSLGAITPSTINGVTISGSGTLAMGSNSLNIGAGGTLGSNAFTSTAYAPIASPTFTGTVTTPALTLGSSTGAVQATAGVLSVITNTGTGNNVLATSPTITTPTISGHFTAEGVTTTGATGTGNLVFSASPTFTGTLSAATVTASGVVTGSGVKLTGLISTSVLATDGSGNIIAGSSLSNPMTTTGDIIYSSNNSGTPARLGIGSNGNVLTVSGGIPAWGSAGSGTVTHTVGALISGNIVVGNGGGDIQTSLLSISSDTISAAPGADLVLSGGTTVSNVQLTPVGSGVGLLLSPNTTASFNIQSSATSATTNIGQLLFQLKDSSGTQNTSSITTSLSTTTHGSDVSYLTFNTLAISSTLSEGMRLTGATLSLNNLTAYAASNLTLTAGSGNQDIILATTGTGPLVFQSNAQVAIQYIQNLTAVSTSNASEFITQLNDSAGLIGASQIKTGITTTTNGSDVTYLSFSNLVGSATLAEGFRLSGAGNLLIGGTVDTGITGSGNLGTSKISGLTGSDLNIYSNGANQINLNTASGGATYIVNSSAGSGLGIRTTAAASVSNVVKIVGYMQDSAGNIATSLIQNGITNTTNGSDVTYLSFSNLVGSATLAEGFRLSGAGNLLVGTTSDTGLTGAGNLKVNAESLTATLVTTGTAAIGGKLTTTATSTLAGLNIGGVSSSPSTLSEGDIWENTTSHHFFGYLNGTVTQIDGGGGGGVTSVATTAGITGGTITSTGTISLDLTYSPTWTGVWTFSPTARTSGVASYMTINAPADTGLTASTESKGINIVGATRTWVDGTVATQREYYFGAPTYNKTTTSATFTTAATVDISGPPTAGTGVTITNPYALRVETGTAYFGGTGLLVGNAGLTISYNTAINNSALSLQNNAITIYNTSGGVQIVTGALEVPTETLSGKITNYNSVTTAGWGVPAIYGHPRATAQTGAASLTSYTVGSSDGSFEVSANVGLTAATTCSFTVTCTYTDETNTSRTLTLNFSQISGTLLTAITNVTGVGAYEGVPLLIRCKASTSITIATTGTFTSCTYNVEANIQQNG